MVSLEFSLEFSSMVSLEFVPGILPGIPDYMKDNEHEGATDHRV